MILIVIALILGISYFYRKELKQVWEKHSKKVIAFALASSIAASGLAGVPSLELNIDDYLIDDISDYEDLGFNIDKIENPIVYEREVLCEGHLPLAFHFKELSKNVSVDENFISVSQMDKNNFNLLEQEVKILTRVDFTFEEPIYEEVEYTYNESVYSNKTGKNETKEVTDYKEEITGYKEVSDYKYVWKDLTSLKQIKRDDIVIIDIIGRFKASTEVKEVDIVPTLNVESYSKTYDKYAWWNSDWGYKKEITLNSGQVPSTLTNFPVCINITNTDLRDNAQSDGDDIAFTNGAEDTQLNHEIEYWDDSTGELVAWVNVTSLAHDSDTKLYMYYGNDEASNQENVEDVWDSDYVAVYHGVDTYDSTSNNYDLDNNNAVLGDSDGFGGGGFGFDGTNNYDLHYDSTITEDFTTISIYQVPDFDPECEGDPYIPISFIPLSSEDDKPVIMWGATTKYLDNEVLTVICDDDGGYISGITNDIFSANSPYITTFRWDSYDDVWEIFVDGSEYSVSHSSKGAADELDNKPVLIGRRDISASYPMDGTVDEIRISNVARSDDWITTEYNSMNNASDGGFFSIGSEFTINGLPNNNITFYGNQGDTVWCNGSGTNNETLELYQDCNSTQEITEHSIYVENMTDGSGNWFSAANISLYASSDNSSFGVPTDDDGNGNGVFLDGGSIITLNTSTWDGGTMGTNPYTIENGTDDTVYVRFKATIPSSETIDRTYFSSNDSSTWAMSFYVNFTGNSGV